MFFFSYCKNLFSVFIVAGSALGPKVWCQLAYWELAQRVGPLFPVELPSVNVFGEDVYGSGLCLETLAQHSFSPPESVCRTRSKIGLGELLKKKPPPQTRNRFSSVVTIREYIVCNTNCKCSIPTFL